MKRTLLTLSLLTTVAITHAAENYTAITIPEDGSTVSKHVGTARCIGARMTGATMGAVPTFAAAVAADLAGYEALALALSSSAGLCVGGVAGFVLIGDMMLPADHRVTTYLYHMIQNGYSKLRFLGNNEEGKALLQADADLTAEELTNAINSYMTIVAADNEKNLVPEAYILGMIEMNPTMDADTMYDSLDPIEQELVGSIETMEAIYAVVGSEKTRKTTLSKLTSAQRKALKEKIRKAFLDTSAGSNARKAERTNGKRDKVTAVKNKVRAGRKG